MPADSELKSILSRTETYLRETLLPFWLTRGPDPEYGGFLTYFDGRGQPTGETAKPFLMQARVLYTLSAAHRAGYGAGRCAELAAGVAGFILDHYWDDEHEGWIWIADRGGRPLNTHKVGYGQCFGLYAFSEYTLATGDPRGREAAERTYAVIARHMIDTRHGGYYELMLPDWRLAPSGRQGGDRKSLDVHMHMLEALTALCELSGRVSHGRRLQEVIDLILTRMLHPVHRLGYIQFSMDFEPLPAILFDTPWGRDAQPEDGVARPLDYTSYGHNMELAWLLLHAADVLGLPRGAYREVVRRIAEHCVAFGMDHEFGGVRTEGPMSGPTGLHEKQFWQQAEVLVALLDAYVLLGDTAYWAAFVDLQRFIFAWFAQMAAGGEWCERVARDGTPIDPALGHAWKSGYHTVRSMIETVRRLRILDR